MQVIPQPLSLQSGSFSPRINFRISCWQRRSRSIKARTLDLCRTNPSVRTAVTASVRSREAIRGLTSFTRGRVMAGFISPSCWRATWMTLGFFRFTFNSSKRIFAASGLSVYCPIAKTNFSRSKGLRSRGSFPERAARIFGSRRLVRRIMEPERIWSSRDFFQVFSKFWRFREFLEFLAVQLVGSVSLHQLSDLYSCYKMEIVCFILTAWSPDCSVLSDSVVHNYNVRLASRKNCKRTHIPNGHQK